MTPFSRLGGLAAASLDAIASALASASPLQRNSYRIAVTGLQRAGKTVFVTSFVHALLHAKDAPIEAFPFFPWRERVRAVELLDIPGLPRFPYAERLAELLAEPPRWPAPTEGLSGVRVRLRLAPAPRLDRRLLEPQTLHLDLIDYPGEWLLDLPLLALDYEQWSVQMEELANAGTRAALSGDWQAQAAGARSRGDGGSVRAGPHRRRLCGLSEALPRGGASPSCSPAASSPAPRRSSTLFFPLSRARGARGGHERRGAGAALRGLPQAGPALLRPGVRPAAPAGRAGRSADRAATGAGIVRRSRARDAHGGRGLRGTAPPAGQVLPIGRLDRLSLVATKADHITSGQLNNLVGLLRDMLGEPFMRANARQSGLLAIASVRATTQETRLWQGEALQFVRGVPNGRSDVVEVRPGEIPGQIPDRGGWNSFVFNIREFAPPRLGAPFDRPLPHINLDKVLQSLIA